MLLISRDVIIDEARFVAANTIQPVRDITIGWYSPQQPATISTTISENGSDGFRQLDRITPEPEEVGISAIATPRDTIIVRPRSAVLEMTRVENEPSGEATMEGRNQGQERDLRRSQRNRKPAKLFPPQAHYALKASQSEAEPETLTDALNSPERERWRTAWESELASLYQNNTWVVEPLPQGQTAIGCCLLFKRKDDGRYKARLVAKGYGQKFGIDYAETFAPSGEVYNNSAPTCIEL